MKNIITVSREYGSGGRIIAKKLAETLKIPFYDKELIDITAKKLGLSPDFIREIEQKKAGSFLYNLYTSSQNLPINDQIFIAESQVIKQIAEEGPCIILGRCADYVLKDNKEVLKTFIYSPLEERIKRVEQDYNSKTDNTKAFIVKKDKRRASYYNYYTNGDWGCYKNYDLMVNSFLGIDKTVEIILNLVK